jgi:hypothetical protein
MLTAVLHRTLALALSLATQLALLRPPRGRKQHPAPENEAHQLWYWLDDHGDIAFPLIGLAIIALLAFGIRRGMASNNDDLRRRQDEKDAIVRMMREKLLVSPDAIASELEVDRFRAAALLEELEREGKLVQQRVSGGVANYRLKGL